MFMSLVCLYFHESTGTIVFCIESLNRERLLCPLFSVKQNSDILDKLKQLYHVKPPISSSLSLT